jgi:polyisoprenoid-binding protein YceI
MNDRSTMRSLKPRTIPGPWTGAAITGAVAVLLGATTMVAFPRAGDPPSPEALAPDVAAHVWGAATVELVTARTGNEARYRVREQLARIEFPSDAVGSTDAIRGAIVLDEEGNVDAARSRFVVDLSNLRSDSDRRDNYVRRNTLRTEIHPEATFVPTAVEGLEWPAPAGGMLHLRVVGDLTVNGVTRSATWDARVRAGNGTFEGAATTEFSFGDFEMAIPRVASVLSVTDRIRLEYDFRLVPAPEVGSTLR